MLDLGAGTGKLTRLLAARYARVLAVEPDDAMRALIPAGEPLAGRAEAIPLADGSVDAVFAAEAFHWFDGERALGEIARVLVPGGVLALLSNRFAPEDHLLPEGLLPKDPEPGRSFASGRWRGAFAGAPFAPLRESSVVRTSTASRDELLAYFASISPITSLTPAERGPALGRVAAALDRPSYERRLTTVLVWTTKLPVSTRGA